MGTRNIFPILAVNIGYERQYNGLNKKIQDQKADEACAQTNPLMPSWLTLHRRDLDQVHADLRSPKHLTQHKTAKPVEDLPGLGRWYCVECAKWFEGEHSLVQHRRGKNHKRRVRSLREEPYTQKEAEAAVGLRTENGKREIVEGESMEDLSAADNEWRSKMIRQ